MIGRLDRRVTFIQPIIQVGESNSDDVTGWEVIDTNDTVWAAKQEGRGNTFVQSDRVTYNKVINWIIRWREDLNVRMRLVYNSQVYEIIDIGEHKASRKRYMNISTQVLDNIYFS